MRKGLLTLSLALLLGGAAAAVATTTGQLQTTQKPVMLAQIDVSPRDGQRGRQPPNPEQRAQRHADLCVGLHARAAGRLTELGVRLQLTTSQQAAFDRWRDVRLAAAKSRADRCASQPVRMGRVVAAAPSPVERMARQEQQLRQRLADISAERPALEALYASLSPEQRQKFTPGGPRAGQGGPRGRIGRMMRERTPGMAPPALPPQ